MEVVTGALGSLRSKLGELLVGEYNLQQGVKGEIRFVEAELESMHGALVEISKAPADQLQDHDRIWARDVRELSYDIEDSIDTFMVRGLRKGIEPTGPYGFKNFIDRCFDLLTQFQIRRNVATELRDIKRRVIEVCGRRDRYKIDNDVAKPVKIDPRLLHHFTKATELVGLDEARDEIIKILIEGDEVSMQQGKIVSIVGFGGLGKTTLANAVFEKISAQFDRRAFVSVSQTPDMKRLFKGMLYELGKNIDEETMDDRRLINELRKFLQEKRCFIVIDDIWDLSVWEIIRCALPDNNSGYRIITTTRILKVAEQAGGLYKLKPLCLRSSRILLYKRIFGNEDKDGCPDEEVGEVSDKILKKCAGVPLAIITIASLLASKGRNKLDWYKVYNSIGAGLQNCQDLANMRKILSLSYYDLPSHLRTCILYLSVFPEDYKIGKDRLIWLWIAEGFIQCGEQGKRLFEVGESYFNELINRSMIQPLNDMNEEHCCVHDMVLDLIRSLSSEENFVTILNDVDHTSPSTKARRLSLQNMSIDPTWKLDEATSWATMSTQQVRSIVVFQMYVNLTQGLQSFRVLRVLDLQSCDIRVDICKDLGNLFQLRYLGLSFTTFGTLPEEIGNLRFLQTLELKRTSICILPSTVVQLRHLMCLRIPMERVPNGIGSLTSLEELSTLFIHDDSTDTLEELGHLTELRVLDIELIEWNDGLDKTLVQSLRKLQKIQSLIINSNRRSGRCNLDGWVAPPHVRRLGLHGCWFSTLRPWMNPSHLLDLFDLHIGVRELQQEDLDILGRLPALRNLRLSVNHQDLGILGGFFAVGASSFPFLVKCQLLGFIVPVVFRQGAMPRLTSLTCDIPLRKAREIAEIDGGFDVGLGNLPSLQVVRVDVQIGGASVEEVEEAKAALRHAAEIHPNHPILLMQVDGRYGALALVALPRFSQFQRNHGQEHEDNEESCFDEVEEYQSCAGEDEDE